MKSLLRRKDEGTNTCFSIQNFNLFNHAFFMKHCNRNIHTTTPWNRLQFPVMHRFYGQKHCLEKHLTENQLNEHQEWNNYPMGTIG